MSSVTLLFLLNKQANEKFSSLFCFPLALWLPFWRIPYHLLYFLFLSKNLIHHCFFNLHKYCLSMFMVLAFLILVFCIGFTLYGVKWYTLLNLCWCNWRCTDPEACKRQIVEDFKQEKPLWILTCYGHSKGYIYFLVLRHNGLKILMQTADHVEKDTNSSKPWLAKDYQPFAYPSSISKFEHQLN